MFKKCILYAILGLLALLPLFAGGESESGNSSSSSSPAAGRGGPSAFDMMDSAMADMDSAMAEKEELTSMDEYYLGRTVAANILSVYKPYTRNPDLTRYINRICQTIAINSLKPEIFNGYHVIILDTPEYNAFASPGGHILITRGLVEAATSEDMLAAIIAHEFAHILYNHSAAIIAEMQMQDEFSAVANRAEAFSARDDSLAARTALFRNTVRDMLDTMMKNGYSQAQEFEADNGAMMLLASSGYNPEALIDMLRILQRVQGSQRGGFNSTHPSPMERISNANRTVGRYRVQDTSSYRTSRFMNK